jgi:hypothetical protein
MVLQIDEDRAVALAFSPRAVMTPSTRGPERVAGTDATGPTCFSRARRADCARDRSVAEDLAQEAAIVLWELDPTRFGARDVEYLRSAMYKRMQFMGRTERRARGGGRRVEVGGL